MSIIDIDLITHDTISRPRISNYTQTGYAWMHGRIMIWLGSSKKIFLSGTLVIYPLWSAAPIGDDSICSDLGSLIYVRRKTFMNNLSSECALPIYA